MQVAPIEREECRCLQRHGKAEQRRAHHDRRVLRRAAHGEERESERLRDEREAPEREILAQAPMVPTYNRQVVDFVSKRVGNYEYHPQWGALLDQLWVK